MPTPVASLKAGIPALLAVAILGVCGATKGAPPTAGQKQAATTVSPDAVDRAITLAGRYLLNSCGPDGKFVYQIDTSNGEASTDYNIVRHAGAMYALATLQGIHPDPRLLDALKRAAAFLRKDYIQPSRDFRKTKTLAVWTSPPASADIVKLTLGATGLGLVGLIGLETFSPGSVPPADLTALGQFLRFMQKSDGRFSSKYFPDQKNGDGRFAAWGSLYYPGEAALALISLYELDGSQKDLAAGENALRYLAKSRLGAPSIPADHWALIATAKLFSLPDQSRFISLRKPLIHHAIQVCESMLADQVEGASPPALDGGFDKGGRTTPTATRLEGLLATLQFLPPEHQKLRARIAMAVRDGVRFLLRSQILTGPYAGGVPRAIPLAEDSAAPKIRIDYVQHFLCVMIRYRHFLQSGENPAGQPTLAPHGS